MKSFILSLTLSLAMAVAAGVRASEVPVDADVLSMTEASLTSFGKCVKKQDFSAFYDDIAAIWQKQTSPEKLKESFKDFFDKDINIPAVVKEMEPVFNQSAKIDKDGVLLLKGYYPTTPHRVVFQLKYLEEEDEWKLCGITVDLKE